MLSLFSELNILIKIITIGMPNSSSTAEMRFGWKLKSHNLVFVIKQ